MSQPLMNCIYGFNLDNGNKRGFIIYGHQDDITSHLDNVYDEIIQVCPNVEKDYTDADGEELTYPVLVPDASVTDDQKELALNVCREYYINNNFNVSDITEKTNNEWFKEAFDIDITEYESSDFAECDTEQ